MVFVFVSFYENGFIGKNLRIAKLMLCLNSAENAFYVIKQRTKITVLSFNRRNLMFWKYLKGEHLCEKEIFYRLHLKTSHYLYLQRIPLSQILLWI